MKKTDQTILYNALQLAMDAHKGQLRKGGQDYIRHPIRVAQRINEWGGSQEMQAAALLHDTLEDTGLSPSEILEHTNESVLKLVITLTHMDDTTFEQYMAQVNTSREALTIKVADRIDNLLDSIRNTSVSFQKRYIKETRQYFTEELLANHTVAWNELQKALEAVEANI